MALTERMQQSQGSVQYFRRIADVQRARLWGVGGGVGSQLQCCMD